MVEGGKPTKKAQALSSLGANERAIKLVAAMLAEGMTDIRPVIDFASEQGFNYPFVEKTLEIKAYEAVSILESLVNKGILKKDFFDRFLHCPQCRSVNLRPTIHCPKCSSGNIAHGRILEHSVCDYVGLEEEFMTQGRLVCPKCQTELRKLDIDYRSLGLMRKCLDCGNVFSIPVMKWRCLKCASITSEDKVSEVNIYSYSLDEAKRSWLEFELKPKTQLIDFLKRCGYKVNENAPKKGRSGAEHVIDILATRDDGVVIHEIAIGIKMAGERVSLSDVFDFDDKAYDSGIYEKVLLVAPPLDAEAEAFASHQRIRVLTVKDLEAVLARAVPLPGAAMPKEPFQFMSRPQMVEYLKHRAYEVKENATLSGRSGAEHVIDILATRDDGIVTHQVAVGIAAGDKPIELDQVFDFDDKAYDIGIPNKVFVASPGLSREARHFAERQRIKVFEVKKLD